MYAIIQSGGKQYRVSEGQVLKLHKLAGEIGDQVDLGQVLMLEQEGQFQVGAPFLSHTQVNAEVVAHGRGKKINIIKFKRRKHHLKRMGHRQDFTQVKITGIVTESSSKPPESSNHGE